MPDSERRPGASGYVSVDGDAARLGWVRAIVKAGHGHGQGPENRLEVELRGEARRAAGAPLARRLGACGTDVRQAAVEVAALAGAAVAAERQGAVRTSGRQVSDVASTASRTVAIARSLKQVGWSRVLEASEDLGSARISFRDSTGRVHFTMVHFPSDFPTVPALVQSDTPVADTDAAAVMQAWARMRAEGVEFTLSDSLDLIAKRAEHFKSLWDALEEVDARCVSILRARTCYIALHHSFHPSISPRHAEHRFRVVDPPKPIARRHVHRKLLMENRCILSLLFQRGTNGFTVEMEARGPEPAATHARSMAQKAVSNFESGTPIAEALAAAFGTSLLSKPGASCDESDARDAGCGICYAHADGTGSVPDEFCHRCKQGFHRFCLARWLTAGSGRKSFHTLTGPCPYCGAELRCAADVA